MAVFVPTQLISFFSLIFLHLTSFSPYLALSINPNNLLLFPSITDRNLSRPAMILPLHLTPPDSSISSFNPRRQLQRSESQHHPNARMRLYDDLLVNGFVRFLSFISSAISFRRRFCACGWSILLCLKFDCVDTIPRGSGSVLLHRDLLLLLIPEVLLLMFPVLIANTVVGTR